MAHDESLKCTGGEAGERLTLEFAPDFLTVRELRDILRIGKKQAYALVRSGGIGSCRLGGSIRIPRAAVERLLAASGSGGSE